MMPQEEPNPLMRKKKTPEELAAEAEAEDEDEFTKLRNTIETQITTMPYVVVGIASVCHPLLPEGIKKGVITIKMQRKKEMICGVVISIGHIAVSTNRKLIPDPAIN
ncbi:complexin-like protein [Lasius niger]|uniref:Complexin-like protein n=1 Tax=Lasius niger TaxID=67767 RepID=A0A0J7KKK9_LASNI|nr:complexin-like protein [Lasius niger]